jgi:chromosomal replication initiation ATPase DnaA
MNLIQQLQFTKNQVTRAMDSLNTLSRRLEIELGRQRAVHGSVLTIQQTVCDHYQLPISIMQSGLRPKDITLPRMTAISLCCELTPLSSTEIGRCFLKDHATVLYAVKKVQDRLSTEPGFHPVYTLLKATASKRLTLREMPLFAQAKAI